MKKTDSPLLFDLQAVVAWAHDEVPAMVAKYAEDGRELYVSIISPWEFLLKKDRQSFGLDYGQLIKTIEELKARFLPIKPIHLETLRSLEKVPKHKDPFDRLLIAQALKENLILVGADEFFPAYRKTSALRFLWKSLEE